MTGKDDDELSTKREMVKLLAEDATGEQLDAAINACIDNRLDDAQCRTVLIETIYRSWCVRVGKRPRPPGSDFAPTWEDVRRMFLDVHASVGVPQRLPQPTSLDEKSQLQDMTAAMAPSSVGFPEPPPPPTSSVEKSQLQDVTPAMAPSSVAFPEPPPQPTSSDEKSQLQDMTAAMAPSSVAFPEPPPQPTSSDEKSAAPMRARLSLNWARARPIR